MLPTATMAGCNAIYVALGITKQTAQNWRDKYDFPPSHRWRINVRAVASWLSAHGCAVDWN
jgi:hypothetical protein